MIHRIKAKVRLSGKNYSAKSDNEFCLVLERTIKLQQEYYYNGREKS